MARLRSRSDEGASMVMVVTAFALLFAIVLTTSLYVVRSIRQTAAYTDSERALSAVETGIADYFARASASPGYWESSDCDNVALQVPVTDPTSATCDEWDATTKVGWAPVEAGESAESTPAYHYEVVDWDVQNGSEATWITVQVTGRSGGEYRTVEVQATRESTEQYTGYQNHWARPGYTCTDDSGARVYQRSAGMYESGSTNPAVYCLRTLGSANYGVNGWRNGTELTVPTTTSSWGDWRLNAWVNPIEGDFFSNDAGFVNPAPGSMNATYTVNGTLTVANPWCSETSFAGWVTGPFAIDCGTLPTSASVTYKPVSRVSTTEEPQLSSTRTLPYDTTALEDAPGCHYYGPTRVVLQEDGTMKVWAKQSGYSGLTIAVPSRAGDVPSCGSAADLTSESGAEVPVPDGMVVYVHDVPTDVVTDHAIENGRLDAHEVGGDATYGYLPSGGVAADALAAMAAAGTVGHTEILMDTSTYASSMYRTQGNLWVEGVLQGTVTLATEGTVLVTGDLVTVGGTSAGSTDQLGLIGAAVTVVDQRVALYGRATLGANGATYVGSYYISKEIRYIDGVDPASGTKGDWPHSYDGDADQVRIEAAIQVLSNGLGYQDDGACILGQSVFDDSSAMGSGGHGWITKSYYDFPHVTLDTSHSPPWVQLPELTDGELTLDVVVAGSLAQNYLSTTGIRNENAHVMGYSGIVTVFYEAGSCGMDLTVEYDERLQTSAPPYLLRFTDVGWERGDASEVTTPARLRS